MNRRVVLTHWVHPEVIDYLRESCEVIPNPSRDSLPREEILQRAGKAQAIMVFMPDTIDEAFLRACPHLKIVSAALKGYDNFDVEACTRHGVWFTIVKDSLTIPATELAFGLMIAITRHIGAGDRYIRSGQFKGWRPQLYGMGLYGRTLGIIGMGAIGQAIARRAIAFRMRVLYEDVVRLPKEKEKSLQLTHCPIDELLPRSDIVMPLLPLKPDTFHLIDSQAIKRMRPGSYLINICRGSVVDEMAVAEGLASNHLAGYAADVFEFEDWARSDRPPAIPHALLEYPDRTFFTPHLGSAVDEVRLEIAKEAAHHIIQALNDEMPDGAVNSP